MSDIQQFYAGQSIFITGGTGFLGKVLVEKLLWSCRDVRTIYLLIRAKKDKSSQERLKEFLADRVFDRVLESDPNFAKKLVPISGDIAARGLGISATDRARLIEDVSMIFHLAATVRFDEKLPRAVAVNVNSVKEIINIGRACKNLKIGVYVSTAFSHSVRSTIEEKLYDPPLSYDEITTLMDMAVNRNWSEKMMEGVTRELLGNWPNTYTYTKAIAEGVVAEYAKGLPFAIYRPSIVVGAMNEPIPGWIANIMGINGVFIGVGLGIIHVFMLDFDVKADLVPVDMTCNALIACARETTQIHKESRESISLYNYVCSPENPLTWGEICEINCKELENTPLMSSIYYNALIATKSKMLFAFLGFWFHLLPALIRDTVGRLFGTKPKMFRLARKIHTLGESLTFFSTQQWDFNNENTQRLWRKLNTDDKKIFPFSMREFDWVEHTRVQVKGIRKYLLHESEDSVTKAKHRRRLQYIVHISVKWIFILTVVGIAWKLVTLIFK